MTQKYKPKLYDSLCDKLLPYVRSAYDSLSNCDPQNEYVKSIVDPVLYVIEDRNALEAGLSKEEPDKEMVKFLADALMDLFKEPSDSKELDSRLKALKEGRIRLNTEIIAASLSQTLEWTLEDNDKDVIQLRDCLLPNEIPEEIKAWWSDDGGIGIDRTGLLKEQVESLLRNFGREEIAYCLELPWDGYISRATNGYELRRLKK